MITHPWILVAVYALLPLALLLSSLRAEGQDARVVRRIVAGLLSFPLLVIAALAVLFWQMQPPTLPELARDFPSHRADLDTLLRVTVENPKDITTVEVLYKRIGVKMGIRKDMSGDAFVMVDSIGLLNRGHVSGYLHCADSKARSPERYEPCIFQQDSGRQEYSDQFRQPAWSYRRLDGQWFAYIEGPS